MRAVLAIAILASIGCGDDGGGGENAPVLWLALDGRETEVKLIDQEPPYF